MSGRAGETESWERLDLQAIEAGEQLAAWTRKDRALHDELIEEARTDLQRELIRRAVASGHTPQELELFADVIRPLADGEAYAACTLDAERALNESLEDRLWAEADPIYGYLLNGYELMPADVGGARGADASAPPTLDPRATIQPPRELPPDPVTEASSGPPRPPPEPAPRAGPLIVAGTDAPLDSAPPDRARRAAAERARVDGFDGAPQDGAGANVDGEPEEEADEADEGDDLAGELHAEPSYRMIPPDGNRPQMVYIAPRPPPQVTATAARQAMAPASRPPPAGVPSRQPLAAGPSAAVPSASAASSASAPLPERIKLPPGMIVDRPALAVSPKVKDAAETEPAPVAAASAPAAPRAKQPPAPGRFAEDLFNDAGRALGVSFTEQQVDGEGLSLERALVHAAAALERGVPVPAVIGPSQGEHRRYILFLQVQTDGGGRAFELHDPMAQDTVWANEADLLGREELPFADKSNRRITSIALPTPPQ